MSVERSDGSRFVMLPATTLFHVCVVERNTKNGGSSIAARSWTSRASRDSRRSTSRWGNPAWSSFRFRSRRPWRYYGSLGHSRPRTWS